MLRVLALALAFVASGCLGRDATESACPPDVPKPVGAPPSEPICFETQDGWAIRGVLERGGNASGPLVVMTHGLGEDHRAFGALAADLAPLAGAIVRFDLRGHGLSVERDGETRAWEDFAPSEFLDMDFDVTGAVAEGLRLRGERDVVHVGASIGANLALRDAAGHPGAVAAVVLLSPGLAYRGVSSEAANAEYGGAALYVASRDDAYAAESAEALARKGAAEPGDLKLWEDKGHGTAMLDPEGRAFVVDWLRGALPEAA